MQESTTLPNGFRQLSLRVTSTRDVSTPHNNNTSEEIVHYLFIKPHRSRIDLSQTPNDRSLFLLNLPVDITEDNLRRMFQSFGIIERVIFGPVHPTVNEPTLDSDMFVDEDSSDYESAVTTINDRKSTFKTVKDGNVQLRALMLSGAVGYIVYESEEAVEKAMKNNISIKSLTLRTAKVGNKKQSLGLGYNRYRALHQMVRPMNITTLKEQTEAAISAYDQQERKKREQIAKVHNKVDEDGFVRVVRAGGRRNINKNADGSASVVTANIRDASYLKKNKKPQELTDFYRFQTREQKRNRLLELRDNFESDKKKIEDMKQSRRFRPY